MALPDENEKIGCRKCHERGYHSRDSIHIISMCIYCGGRGYVDWIDRMTGNPSPLPHDKSVEKKLVMRNVEHLMTEIKNMLFQINIDAVVNVEESNRYDHRCMATYGLPSDSPSHMISKRRTKKLISI